MQHCTDHRHGKETLQIAMGVPVHDRHRIARLDPLCNQCIGQSLYPLAQIAIGVAESAAVHDFLLRCIHHRTKEQILDQQLIVVSGRGTRDMGIGHGVDLQ